MKNEDKIFIIGGGLSGLALAYFLSKKNIRSTILEGSPRLGGRIQTIYGSLGTPLELGATWFSDSHSGILTLMDELGLRKYQQYTSGRSLVQLQPSKPPKEFIVPNSEQKSYRIKDGTQQLINTLIDQLDPKSIHLNTVVNSIREFNDELIIIAENGSKFKADKVVLCLPPQIAGANIKFSPELPKSTQGVLTAVHTWMGGSIKFVLEYANPFWRDSGYSGMLFSQLGIIAEMHDHSNFEGNKFGFTGFLNNQASFYSGAYRRVLVLQQLTEILGPKVNSPLFYMDKIWSDGFIQSKHQVALSPHQNNGHPLLQQSYMSDKLFFSGTESAAEYPGYMEGAIRSAYENCATIIANY